MKNGKSVVAVCDYMDVNVYVVGDQRRCVVIDSGASPEAVQKAVGARVVLGVFLTHGHFDHSYYAAEYAKIFSCKVFAGRGVREYLEDSFKNYSDGHFELHDFTNFEFFDGDGTVVFSAAQGNSSSNGTENGVNFEIQNQGESNQNSKNMKNVDDFAVTFKTLGGHTKCDVVFKIDDNIFVGDLLLGRYMGRIDLYGASKEKMLESLRALKDEQYRTMFPGHGQGSDKQTQDKVADIWLKYLSR